jgi:hypothetical protein
MAASGEMAEKELLLMAMAAAMEAAATEAARKAG